VCGGRIGPLTGARLTRELGELAWAGALAPWGCTAPSHRALRWLLGGGPTSAMRCTTPVILVHGYGGNRSHWLPLELELRRAGFANVHTVAYNPVTTTLAGTAGALRTACREAMAASGSNHVHLVGHSLGGVVVRYAVQRLGLAADVRTAVTVAAPHRGTPLASWGWGPLARVLRPGSPLLKDLDRATAAVGVRWVAYWSDADLVVRPGSARLDEQGSPAVNVLVPDVGHLGILRAPAFLGSLRQLLLDAEGPGAAAPVAA
jgi:pimeloyl-ACP methyl ester carboxylesterase